MAAGNSTRCGFDKLLAELGNQSVLERSIQTFMDCELVDEIWVAGKTIEPNGKLKGSIEGGDSRFKSVSAGLEYCAGIYSQDVRIIVHNAANPHLTKTDLEAGITKAEKKQNIVFGFFSPNSIKQVQNGMVTNFLDRAEIFETQTPQISTLHTFMKALQCYDLQKDAEPRDEAELLNLINEDIYVYECDTSNTKITFASDLTLPSQTKLGLGEDSHRFAADFIADKAFRLGGIDMSEGRLSSDGNSDGDLILHSLCNALLSAFGDKTFDPIAAPICAAGDTNSASYLQATLEHLAIHHQPFTINQLLISLEGAQPRLAPQHEKIVHNLAQLLSINSNKIGLTYTTGEGLSDYGKGLGMHAYVLLTLTSSQ